MAYEKMMKERGVNKVEKELFSTKAKDKGKTKSIGSTQGGQQIILEETVRICPMVWSWINKDTWKSERGEWLKIFVDEKTTSSLIASTLLLLIGSTHAVSDVRSLGSLKRKLQTGQTTHKARHSTIEKINKKIFKEELGFSRTFRFIELLVDLASFLTRIEWIEHGKNQVKSHVSYSSNLIESVVDELTLKAAQAFYPLPLDEKPLDWILEDGKIEGGYRTHQFEMVRIRGRKPDYSKYSENVFNALNYIQSTKWRINEAVLRAVIDDLKPPSKVSYVKTPFPKVNDFKALTSEEKEQLDLYNAEMGDFESAVGKWRSVKMGADIAELYLNKDLYFPHNFDFRGRVYPLSIGLSPQGSDEIKGMIEYAEGEALTKRGRDWCYAYLATLFGEDKVTFSHRVKIGEDLLYEDYLKADEPYQFLAHQMEMQKYEIDNSYSVKTRIHLDACNSGSQFTSAITGDLKGCKMTNIIPHPEGLREDAYQEVAAITLKALREEKEQDEETKFLIGLIESDGREVCKRPVMVSNYGGTAGGRATILYHLFREFGADRKWINRKTSTRLSKVIGDAIEGVLVGGKEFERYIQKMNLIIAKKSKPIHWITDDGFYVEHVKYREKTPMQVQCTLPSGKRTHITRPRYSNTPNPGKMKSAISPNYIHSLDAMLVRQVALELKDRGIKNVSFIHDSFGTSPNNVDTMLDITKQTFIKLVKKRPLKELHRQLVEQAMSYGVSEKELGRVNYPQLRGFNSDGGIDSLMFSEWFFS